MTKPTTNLITEHQSEQEQERKDWALGDYIGKCPNCGRSRLCKTNKGVRCEKCDYMKEAIND